MRQVFSWALARPPGNAAGRGRGWRLSNEAGLFRPR